MNQLIFIRPLTKKVSDCLRLLRHACSPSILCAILVALVAQETDVAAEVLLEGVGEKERFFEAHVRPLLVTKCHSCHGTKVAEGGLRLDSRHAVLTGSESGAVVVLGDAASSKLLAMVRRTGDVAMPPDEKLSADEIAILSTWIAAGLPWSGAGNDGASTNSAGAIAQSTIEARIAEALSLHWAFKPAERHTPLALPAAFVSIAEQRSSGAAATIAAPNPSRIDQFIVGQLVAKGLNPSPASLPQEAIRRLWFDLVGLPPPADEVDAFSQSPTEEAFTAIVDRLLASPEHAEHWTRKWLDLARYADTMGYAFDNQDSRYPFAWTYRDWVVRALAHDLPYDQFITLQLAADRMQPPVPREDLAALGFLTVGRTFLGNTHDIIDDRIDLVTRGLMGLTVACARCHDHKYEPVSTADYYALHGIFASSQIPEELPIIGAAAVASAAEVFVAEHQLLEAAVAEHAGAVYARAVREAIAHAADYFYETARPTPRTNDNRPPRLADGYELEQLLLDRLVRLFAKNDSDHPILGAWQAVHDKTDDQIADHLKTLHITNQLVREEIASAQPTTLKAVAECYARVVMQVAPLAADTSPAVGDSPDRAAVRDLLGREGTPLIVLKSEAMRVASREEQTERRKRLQAITRHQVESPGGPPRAMALIDTTPVDSPILLRGNPAKPSAVVRRRLPSLLGGAAVASDSSGRLELAAAIVAPHNPLTARVIVNWVWLHHMGRGFVDTPGDLGLRGESPIHQELFDDLTRRFVEDGKWSLRWLHREIVTSATWRQSSAMHAEHARADPDNRLLTRANRRRLDWEAWRDSLLVAAGTLDPSQRGGPGIDPLTTTSLAKRSLYSRIDRQDVPGMLRVFDSASPDMAVHVRSRTIVPQQSLAVLNGPLIIEAARRVAARVDCEIGDSSCDSLRIQSLWRVVLSRSPTADEQAEAVAWLAQEEAVAGTSIAAASAAETATVFDRWGRLAHALLATAEFQWVD